jgi:hypothetical protein
MTAIVAIMNTADPTNIYTYSIDRTMNGGLENRATLTTTAASFTLFFNAAPSVGPLIGFASIVYSGFTTYTGSQSAGTVLIPEFVAYTYLGPEFDRTVQGAINISANGEKEAVVFANQQFISMNFKYEPQAKVIVQWTPFFDWAIQQRPFEFTPQTTQPATVYDVTLEKTTGDGKGLGMRWSEMLPDFPFSFQTGGITFRRRVNPTFII